MGNLQVKNVPEGLHDELRARADRAGLSLRDYVLRVLEREVAVPASLHDEVAALGSPAWRLDVPEHLDALRREREDQLRDRASETPGAFDPSPTNG